MATRSSSAPAPKTIVGFGGVLWDFLPAGKQLGGAPANFAFHANQLGHRGVVLSSVGTDELGTELVSRLEALGLSTEHIQRDPAHPTGGADVALDAEGRPVFTIHPDVAWDYIAWNGDLERLAGEADAVCFGTSSQRSPVSRRTLRRFLEACRSDALIVCDVNFRQDSYTPQIVRDSLDWAHVLKLNEDEIVIIAEMFDLGAAGERDIAKELIERFDLQLVCVSRGAEGCLLVGPDSSFEAGGIAVTVADTVGSGDAFMAAAIHHLLKGSSLSEMAKAANRLGAYVATQHGAMPAPPPEVLAEVR